MEIDRLVGVNVTDETMYEEYRANMAPILASHGGRFVVDVRVSEVLLAPGDGQFNRLFTIRFPTEQAMDRFFQSPEYLEVRQQFFVPSVSSTSPLSKYKVLQ